MVGPQGCGKTRSLAVKAALLAGVNAPTAGILVVPTYSQFERIHAREWPEILRGIGVDVKVRGGNVPMIEFPWGVRLYVYSAETPGSIVGINAGWAVMDEPAQMQREAYDRACDRVRNPEAPVRQMVLTGTPEGLNWFSELFSDPQPPRRTIWAREWHPSMAHYPRQLAERYAHDPGRLAAYARGEFVPMDVGRCYGGFERGTHVRPVEYDPALELILTADFNVHTMRWLILQVSRDEIHVLDEIALGGNETTESAAREFVRRWNGGFHRGEVVICGDASGQARKTSATRTDYQILLEELRPKFRSVRLNVPAANPPVRERVEAVNYHLAGRGRKVVIAPTCKELVLDLERVCYRKGSSEIDKSDGDRTHASDAFGYAIWSMARPTMQHRAPATIGVPSVPLGTNPARVAF